MQQLNDSYRLTLCVAIALGLARDGAIQQVAVYKTSEDGRSENTKRIGGDDRPLAFYDGILGLRGLDYAWKPWRHRSRVGKAACGAVLACVCT